MSREVFVPLLPEDIDVLMEILDDYTGALEREADEIYWKLQVNTD